MIISIDPTTGVERERFAYHSRREIDTILSTVAGLLEQIA